MGSNPHRAHQLNQTLTVQSIASSADRNMSGPRFRVHFENLAAGRYRRARMYRPVAKVPASDTDDRPLRGLESLASAKPYAVRFFLRAFAFDAVRLDVSFDADLRDFARGERLKTWPYHITTSENPNEPVPIPNL